MDSDSEGIVSESEDISEPEDVEDSESEASLTASESSSSSESLVLESDNEDENNSSSHSVASKHDKDDLEEDEEDDFYSDTEPSNKSVKHDDVCKVCRDGGELVLCDACPHVYHPKCLNPPLEKLPEGEFLCPRCACEPIGGKVRSILTWRWDPEETELYRKKYFNSHPYKRKYMAQPRREYFVHLYDKSYWDCVWVKDIQMQVHHPQMLRSYVDKHHPEEPPTFSADEGEEEEDDDYGKLHKEGIKNGLKERYYDNGVNPIFLQIDRIIDHKTDHHGVHSYCVKWKKLAYEYCTWETEQHCDPLLIADFYTQVEIYQEYRNYFLPENKKQKNFVYKHITTPPTTPTTDLGDKFKSNADLHFLDSTSGLILHDYQIDGLNWLRYSFKKDVPVILADEMGLGKTVQAITFMYSLYREGHCKGPFLISAPLSTIINWERELSKWAPDFYVVTYLGDKQNRESIRLHELTYDKKAARGLATNEIAEVRGRIKFHVLLTSYEFISIDASCLQSVDYAMIVIDEAHRLKSGSSKFFVSLAEYQTNFKCLLTGTPLQNKLEELYYLLNFLCPVKFGSLKDFMGEFSDISKEDQIDKLHKMLGDHMLRRVKADVLKNMPTKSELIVPVELSAMQKDYYKHVLTKNFDALNSKEGGKVSSLNTIFVELKKCCNHPYLFSKAMMSAKLTNQGQQNERYEIDSLTEASGKLVLLRKMLKKLKEQNHRVLIFSQMTRMLDLLEDFLAGEGYSYERIDGSIKGSDRQTSIDRFNEPKSSSFVFLLSTKAGGLGINLATADTVFIYDSDWNPHNDLQALSRAHRIGQKNKVMIYRFVTRKTIEERVAEVCKQKMLLTQLAVGTSRKGAKGDQMSFSKQELEKILRFGTEALFKSDDTSAIHYTDEEIDTLLDRSQHGSEKDEGDEGNVINDYLGQFKIANFSKNKDEDNINGVNDDENLDPSYWKKLLNRHGELDSKDDDATPLYTGRQKRKATMKLTQYKDVGGGGRGRRDRDDYEYDDEYQPPVPKAKKPKLDVGGAKSKRGRPRTSSSKKSLMTSSPKKGQMSNGQSSKFANRPSTSGGWIQADKKAQDTTPVASSSRPNRLPESYFSDKMYLSSALSKLVDGRKRMSRSMIKRHITLEIIEPEGLYDPDDPHCDTVICNKELRSLFGVNRFKISEMFKKYLDQHLRFTEEEEEEVMKIEPQRKSSPSRGKRTISSDSSEESD